MESNAKINTLGFTPRAEFLTSLDDKLSHLSEICPYDAALAVTIVKKPVQYEFSIVMHFVGGRMSAECYGANLEKITEKGLDKFYDRICQWHTKRFEEDERPDTFVAKVNQTTPSPRVLIVDDDPM